MNNLKYILPILTLLALACGKTKDHHEESGEALKNIDEIEIVVTSQQFENGSMRIGSFEEKPFPTVVRANGIIDVPPQSRAIISAFSGGFIKDLPVQVGSNVTKGERVVTIENPEFISLQQQYVELSEQLAYLKSEYERQQIMLDEKITSQKNFLKVESDYKSSLVRYQSLKKNLEMLNISPNAASEGKIASAAAIMSPIQGSVSKVFVNRGSFVSPADKIMEIINTDEILLDLKVFEKDLLQLHKDQPIKFKISEASSEYFEGTISLVGASIDPKTRMATVLGKINKTNNTHFSAGMFSEAEIIVSAEKHAAVPESAVTEFEGSQYILELVDEDNNEYHFMPRKVNVEKISDGFILIKNPERFAGKKILIDGGFMLLREEGGGHSH